MSFGRMKRGSAVLLAAVCAITLCAGCSSENVDSKPEDVVLIDPVGVQESYETVERRNLYDYKIYDGIVCPYTEELELQWGTYFDGYAALPGESVKKGQTILKADTEQLDEQIEKMREQMAEDEESYREYMEENQESLESLLKDEEVWGGAVERWEKEKPAEYLEEENETGGDPVPNPAYEQWKRDMDLYETRYRNALIGRQKLEAALAQREELYQLDLEHQKLLLQRLETQRSESNLLAEMPGYLSNVKLRTKGDYMYSDTAMAVVADTERKLIKTEFINRQDVSSAERIYAVIGGKHYDVEYEPMDSTEYNRLSEANGKVYSTFYPQGDLEDLEMGTYVAVAVIRKSRQNALTVSEKVISSGEDGSYVYVLRDGERVYTPVTTGIHDGVYMEILSGLNEGDLVVSQETQPKVGASQKLTMGSVSHQVNKTADLMYFDQVIIDNPVEHGTVYFEECGVSLFQQVKKGDVLVKIRVEPDGDELARLEKSLLRERERTEDLRKQDEEENAKAIKAREKTIADLESRIEEVKADYALTEIRAPYDGIVININWGLMDQSLKAGDLLSPGYFFLGIAPLNSNYLTVEDADGLLTMGNRAVLEYSSQQSGRITAEGQVVSLNLHSVSADMLMTEQDGRNNSSSSVALIMVSAEEMQPILEAYLNNGEWWRNSIQATVTTRQMDNVLLIPKRAVLNMGGATYAKLKLDDGTVMYQGFVAGGSDSEYYWVAEGLTEGMEVCIE